MNDRDHPTIELGPIDIKRFEAGNTGVPYIWTFDSGRAGPRVMINALTHGNEMCGAHAVSRLLDAATRPVRGTLTFGFANVGAYESFDPGYPFVSRFLDEDFNRVWDAATLEGPRASRELARARALRPVIDRVDHLLDIHSTELPQAAMLLAGTRPKNLALARAVGFPAHVVQDGGHKSGRRLRDYGHFDDAGHGATSLLVECGSHFERNAADVALRTALLFLRHFGTVDDATIERLGGVRPGGGQTVVEVTEAVTIATDTFRFERIYEGFEVVPAAGTVIGHDGPTPVRTPYANCVMVMPARNPTKGLTAVRLGRLVDG